MKFKNYLSLVKFSHTVFAMPFAISGYFLAIHFTPAGFSWKLLVLVILCMVFARNAAMAFNRYVDREIDLRNPRTALREIPSGLVKPKSALKFVFLNAILFMATAYFINLLTFRLSPLALIIILGYSFTKQFTVFCHFILGLGLSLAPIGAYLALTGEFHILPLFFSAIVLLWSSGFDIIYALQDISFDKEEELKSVPVTFGKRKSLVISSLLHGIVAIIVAYIGIAYPFGLYYWIGAALFIGLLLYQHLIVKPHDLSRVNIAFFTTNGLASLVFSAFVIGDMNL